MIADGKAQSRFRSVPPEAGPASQSLADDEAVGGRENVAAQARSTVDLDGDYAALSAWEERLLQAGDDLWHRHDVALQHELDPAELLALAAEKDKIAADGDRLADAYDDLAAERDRAGLSRDVRGSWRDQDARAIAHDSDPGFADRTLAGTDRDDAAGDRGDSHDDRARARRGRQQAADDRRTAAVTREGSGAGQANEAIGEADGLRAAIAFRTVIGQAQGMLMARHALTPERAFAVLVRLSQHANVDLRDVAAQLTAEAEQASSERSPLASQGLAQRLAE